MRGVFNMYLSGTHLQRQRLVGVELEVVVANLRDATQRASTKVSSGRRVDEVGALRCS